MSLTSDDLVVAVRRLAFLPDASDITAAEILSIADQEMLAVLSMLEKDSREEYAIFVEDTALSSALTYRLPRRALARTVRSVSLVDADGRERRLTEEDAAEGGIGWLSSDQWTGRYYFQGDAIGFRAVPPTGWSLRVRFTRRPSKLIAVASGAAIQKPGNTTTLTLSTGQSSAALATAMLVDIVRGDSPFDLMYIDRKVSAYTASTSIGFDSSTPVVVADFVNRDTYTNDRVDYVCPRDQTVYPPMAETGWPVLVAACARRVLEEIGDRHGAEVAEATLRGRVKAHNDMIQPRNEQGSKAIVNRSSPLRGGSRGGGRRWF